LMITLPKKSKMLNWQKVELIRILKTEIPVRFRQVEVLPKGKEVGMCVFVCAFALDYGSDHIRCHVAKRKQLFIL
jgi:hypothetical protein